MPARPRQSAPPVELSYEQSLQELEQLVQSLESGQLSLDDTLQAYARGSQLLAACRARLSAVEQQVQVLDGGVLQVHAGDRDD